MRAFSSVGDRVPDHVGGQRDRKSVSRIDGAISGNGGLRIKIVVLQRIMLTRRVTHRYRSYGPRPTDVFAKQQGRDQIALYRGLFRGLTPLPMAEVAFGVAVAAMNPINAIEVEAFMTVRTSHRTELAHGVCGQGDRPNGPQARRRPSACRIAGDPSGRLTE
jgi:hypothetical protein